MYQSRIEIFGLKSICHLTRVISDGAAEIDQQVDQLEYSEEQIPINRQILGELGLAERGLAPG